jgi:outer membrane lipoprotein carrier protein
MALHSFVLWLALAAAGPDAGAQPAARPAAARPTSATPAKHPPATTKPGKKAEAAKPATEAKPAGAATGGALPLAEVVTRMQKQYEGASDFRARFSQKYTSAATGRERTLAGELFIKKPGRMRWNYETPTPQMYLANGQTFWLYEPEEKQAYKQDLKSSQLPAAVSFLMGRGKLGDEFDISFAKEVPGGDPKAYRLALKPKKAQSTYRAIYFIVNPTTFFVDQSILINAEGDLNAITFSDVKTNTKLGDDLFKWAPPPDVRVIDANH